MIMSLDNSLLFWFWIGISREHFRILAPKSSFVSGTDRETKKSERSEVTKFLGRRPVAVVFRLPNRKEAETKITQEEAAPLGTPL